MPAIVSVRKPSYSAGKDASEKDTANGTPMGMAGGYAMTGARFSTGNPDDKKEDEEEEEAKPKL